MPLTTRCVHAFGQHFYAGQGSYAGYRRRQRTGVESESVSILLVQLVPQGLIFGADRNITSEAKLGDGTMMIYVSGQSQRPKVLKWPNSETIVGYVGAGRIAAEPTHEWLYGFIGRNLTFDDLGAVAALLRDELDNLFNTGDILGPLVIHLGGFVEIDGEWTPRVYFVHNTDGLTDEGEYILGTEFQPASEELTKPEYFGNKSAT